MGFSKTSRLLSMLMLTLAFFLVEIVVGYMSNSVALIADSFHMLSDVVALIIAFVSVRISKHQSKKNTFGWARAEVLGALVNSAFLLALSFSIFVEALKRLVSSEEVKNPVEVLIVGSVGLVINILGLFLFHGHAHGHSHGHSHVRSEHSMEAEHTGAESLPDTHVAAAHHPHRSAADIAFDHILLTQQQQFNEHHIHSDDMPLTKNSLSRTASVVSQDDLLSHRHSVSPPAWPRQHDHHTTHRQEGVGSPTTSFTEQHNLHNDAGHNHHSHSHHHHRHDHGAAQNDPKTVHSHDLNMRAAFLHVLGDAVGSIVVIISALVIWLSDWSFRNYIDPILSIVLVGIIIFTTVPVLRESAHVLLQTVPVHIQVDELRRKLIGSFPEIYSVHELHIWQLTGNKIIASAHIQCPSQGDYMQLAKRIKTFFHNEGIHSTTIQPEFALGYGLKGTKSMPAFETNNRTANAGGDAYADDTTSVPFAAARPAAAVDSPGLSYEMASGNPISGIRTAICGEPKAEEVILNTCALTCPTGSVCKEDMCCDPSASQRPMTPPAHGKTATPNNDGVPRKRGRLLKMFSRTKMNNDESVVVLSSDVQPVGQREQAGPNDTVVI